MDAHQHGLIVVELPLDQGEMVMVVDLALINVEGEMAEFARQVGGSDALDQDLMAPAVFNHRLDGDDAQAELPGQLEEDGQARHGAVFIHDLAEYAGRIGCGRLRKIHHRLGVAGAAQDTAADCSDRKDVAGLGKVDRLAGRIDEGTDGGSAVGRGDPGRHPAVAVIDRDGKGGPQQCGVVAHHEIDVQLFQPLRRHRNADQTAAVFGHEIDRFGRHLFGEHDKIALVLAIFVIHDDNDLALPEILDGLRDRIEDKLFLHVHSLPA